MQIFKFGGASVKNAECIKNVATILQLFVDVKKVVVISAIGKTTNRLENAINLFVNKDEKYLENFNEIYQEHVNIAKDLAIPETDNLYIELNLFLSQTLAFLTNNKNNSYTFIYDQVVPLGEFFSTLLVSSYLNKCGLNTIWIDAREMISTNSNFTEAKVNFEITTPKIKSKIDKKKLSKNIILTQGFIGRNEMGFSTTLGREGSDYTASVLAFCLDAQKVVIWKDVPAVLNSDPRLFSDTIKLEKLSYSEAIEMTYYGAQVIHPKTIKPLQNKNIPLQVRSFLDLAEEGTMIGQLDKKDAIHYPPIIVYKVNQALISISVKDFSFVTEDNMSIICQCFSQNGMRMNMIHSGAISFSVCTEYKDERTKALIKELKKDFEVKYNINLELLTIRHYTEEKIDELTKGKEILLQEKTRNTIQILMRKR